jgi:uncharacterized protein (TIGR02145 family)
MHPRLMKHLILISILSITFTQELKVEGNLNVTGAVINDSLVQVIDSLKTHITTLQSLNTEQQSLNTSLQNLIIQLQTQIYNLQTQISLLGDNAGLADCFGVVGGDAVLDGCGICDGDGSNGIDCPYQDIDGNIYETVQIGEQIWMAENLKVTHYRNGEPIPHFHNDGEFIDSEEGAYLVYPVDNDYVSIEICGNDCSDIFGNLYNRYVVEDERGICPENMHIPTDEEFKTLEIHLGMSGSDANSTGWRGSNEGSKLAGNYSLWTSVHFANENLVNNGGFGTSSFNALPAGHTQFVNIGVDTGFWLQLSNGVNRRYIDYSKSQIWRGIWEDYDFLSIRCPKD